MVEAENAKNYLIEEMAVITLQARVLPSVKIYPGEELSSLNVVRHGLIEQAPKGLELEYYAKIKLERRHDFKSVLVSTPSRTNDASLIAEPATGKLAAG